MDKPNGRPQIPPPPHPERRQEPLPWERPKPRHEDKAAPAKVKALLGSPSYRLAEEDAAFLGADEMRGVRLQIDYLKPQQILDQHDVKHTIVVFGGTRILDPGAARRRVEDLETALRTREDPELRTKLVRAKRVLGKATYYEVARSLGRLVGEFQGPANSRIVVMTGGGPGVMEAANRGAHEVGAKTVGLNIDLPREQFPNPYVTPELCFRLHYFALRKLHFLLRAKALVAFPGGYGTLDELFETLTLTQTRKIAPMPVVLVGEEYWRRVVDFRFLLDEGVIDQEDHDLFWFAETGEQIWEGILAWHRANGTPLEPTTDGKEEMR